MRRPRDRFQSPRRCTWLAPALVLLGISVGRGQDPAALVGSWAVAERGPGAPPDLLRLEIQAASRPGDFVTAAVRRGPDGVEAVRGSGRLERLRSDAGPGWQAEWADGPTTLRLTIRPAADRRLALVVRLRDRARPWLVPERVAELILSREAAPILAADGPAPTALTVPARPTSPDRAGLFVVGVEGDGLREVAGPDGFLAAAQPSWAPDGDRLAFAAFDATRRDPLVRVVPERGGPTLAIAAGLAPTWSRDGSQIAYMASGKADFARDWDRPGQNDERIEAVRLVGPAAGQVETLAGGLWPRWCPTDDRLAFVARQQSNWDVFVRSVDGMDLLRLTDDPALDTFPVWTPDGASILFLSDRGNRWDLYRVAADGKGKAVRMTNHPSREHRADLSPDGRVVAFADTPNRTGGKILLLDLASGAARPLLDPGQGDRDPCWSPDGRRIAFASRR